MTEKINSENIILIGMPGAGKSTCGVLAAKLLLKNFFDTDLLIQSRERKRLQQIIDDNGLEYFKKAEENAGEIGRAIDGRNPDKSDEKSKNGCNGFDPDNIIYTVQG